MSEGVIIQYTIFRDSCCSRCNWYHCWVLTMVFLREFGESSSRTHMNDCSGIIVISWLSSFPSSDPTGRDSASAAVCKRPGVCCNSK